MHPRVTTGPTGPTEQAAAREAREQAAGAGEQAAARLAAEEELRKEQESGARLQEQMRGLLAEQRAAFDEELAASRGALTEVAELRRRLAAADEESARMRKEVSRLSNPRPTSREEPAAAKDEKTKRSVLGKLDIDEQSDKSVGQQLKDALRANAGRVIDLFREWDTDGDGEVSRKEFHVAMPRLGFDATKAAVVAVVAV